VITDQNLGQTKDNKYKQHGFNDKSFCLVVHTLFITYSLKFDYLYASRVILV